MHPFNVEVTVRRQDGKPCGAVELNHAQRFADNNLAECPYFDGVFKVAHLPAIGEVLIRGPVDAPADNAKLLELSGRLVEILAKTFGRFDALYDVTIEWSEADGGQYKPFLKAETMMKQAQETVVKCAVCGTEYSAKEIAEQFSEEERDLFNAGRGCIAEKCQRKEE